MNLGKKIVSKLPQKIKLPVKYAYGAIPPKIRYGKVFWDTYNFLEESQWWSQERLQEFQLQELNKLLHHAYRNVPYYGNLFNKWAIKPKDIKDVSDLNKVPFLNKDALREHASDLVEKNVKLSSLPYSHTSGTTGKPLQFYENFWTSQKEKAFIYHQWSRVGVRPDTPIIQIRGAIIKSKKPIEYDPAQKVLRLSPRINDKAIVSSYLEEIKKFGCKYIHGYPSSIASLATLIKEYGFVIAFKLNAVLFASEPVYSWQKRIVEEVFGCRVFSHYGVAEKVVLASECEKTHNYHCVPQYSLVEIEPETHEIIGTSFLNYINPFIRYRTTDIATQPLIPSCQQCRRQYFPIFSDVEGRLEDFITTPKGFPVSPAVITHPFKNLKTIKDTQIIQKSPDFIELRIVPWSDSRSDELKKELTYLAKELKEIIDPDMNIQTEVVDSIPASNSGKFRWIINTMQK